MGCDATSYPTLLLQEVKTVETTESIESINRQLRDLFGLDTVTDQSLWRVVWSDDQFENRLMEYTPSGFQLLLPEVIQVRKYSYVHHRYVLERLVVVPVPDKQELADVHLSYEPMWVFQNEQKEYLPPRMDACKFIVDTVYAAMGKRSLRKYVENDEGKEKRAEKLHDELFGNETSVGDALAYKEGVVVPQNYPERES